MYEHFKICSDGSKNQNRGSPKHDKKRITTKKITKFWKYVIFTKLKNGTLINSYKSEKL